VGGKRQDGFFSRICHVAVPVTMGLIMCEILECNYFVYIRWGWLIRKCGIDSWFGIIQKWQQGLLVLSIFECHVPLTIDHQHVYSYKDICSELLGYGNVVEFVLFREISWRCLYHMLWKHETTAEDE
jgi:hypothetical protein